MPWSPIGIVQPRVRRTTKKSNWGPYMHWFYLVICNVLSSHPCLIANIFQVIDRLRYVCQG
jgi:hypothetical protein